MEMPPNSTRGQFVGASNLPPERPYAPYRMLSTGSRDRLNRTANRSFKGQE